MFRIALHVCTVCQVLHQQCMLCTVGGKHRQTRRYTLSNEAGWGDGSTDNNGMFWNSDQEMSPSPMQIAPCLYITLLLCCGKNLLFHWLIDWLIWDNRSLEGGGERASTEKRLWRSQSLFVTRIFVQKCYGHVAILHSEKDHQPARPIGLLFLPLVPRTTVLATHHGPLSSRITFKWHYKDNVSIHIINGH